MPIVDRLQQRIPPERAEYLHHLATATLAILALAAFAYLTLVRGPSRALERVAR